MQNKFAVGVCLSAMFLSTTVFSAATAPNVMSELQEEIKWVNEDIKSDVTSMLGLSIWESPGSIRIITKEEIQASGAQDLVDILDLRPNFVKSGEGGWNLTYMNNHGIDSGTTILYNGHDIAEGAWNSNLLNGLYPVDRIERVEIISSGAGTLYNGGVSTVVNVITDQRPGSQLNLGYRQIGNQFGRYAGNVSYADNLFGWKIFLQGFLGKNKRVDKDYVDQYEDTWSKDSFTSEPWMMNLDITNSNLKISAFAHYNKQGFVDPDTWYTEPQTAYYSNYGIITEYKQPVINNFDLVSKVEYRQFNSERLINPTVSDETELAGDWGTYGSSYRIESKGIINYSDELSAAFGGTYWHQDFTTDYSLYDTENYLTDYQLSEAGIYAETYYKNSLINLSLGGRLNKFAKNDWELLPRLSASKKVGNLFLKGSYIRSFDTPGPKVLEITDELKNMYSHYLNLEALYIFNPDAYLQVTLSEEYLKNTVEYVYLNSDDFYYNRDGFQKFRYIEADLAFKSILGKSLLSLSYFYSAQNAMPEITNYITPAGTPPGVPKTTLTYRTRIPLTDKLTFTPVIRYSSDVYSARQVYKKEVKGYVFDDFYLYKGGFYINLSVNYALTDKITLTTGINNVLDLERNWIYNYKSEAPTFPDASRSIFASVKTQF